MLSAERISVSYGPINALKGASVHLADGEVGAVIGANGAGKSTLLKAISGIVNVREGTLALTGDDMTKMPAHKRYAMGIAHVLEGHRAFGDQTVQNNLLLGALGRFRKRRLRGEVMADLALQYDRFPILGDRRAQRADTLSGGERQMLATAVALMSRPRILLLDEPSLGLAPKMVEATFELILELKREGLTILLVEQLASLALQVADTAWLLRGGVVVSSGDAEAMLGGLDLRDAYLGSKGERGSSSLPEQRGDDAL